MRSEKDDQSAPVSRFMARHYRHFNGAALLNAAKDYRNFIAKGNRMMVTLAGAMSTSELGRSLAEMIRTGQVHAVSTTGANLEEDFYNLIAHQGYRLVPDYRTLSGEEEKALFDSGLNRVTDTCIPESAIRRLDAVLLKYWQSAEADGKRYFPHEFLYQMIRDGAFRTEFEIDPADSWLVAAAEKNLLIVTPGWEDSTCGNIFASHCMEGRIKDPGIVRSGIEAMMALAEWYTVNTRDSLAGFFQIGGGIAGDFPICVVPMLTSDLEREVPLWGYFCQISDSTTSYGGYSGAVPNEKITWGKLGPDTPRHLIESDASIVAPLIFAHVLGW